MASLLFKRGLMDGDVTIEVDSSEADRAANEARDAAEQARLAAAMAAGASMAQASDVAAVMAAAREDAGKARADAEQAAQEADEAASDAIATNVAVLGQFQRFQDAILTRIDALQQVVMENKCNCGSRPSEQEPSEPEIQEIAPEGQTTDGSTEEENAVPTGNRRKNKIRRR